MEIISREEAIRKGLTAYFTGKPCKHGHISERLVADWKCKECKYNIVKRWRRENPNYEKDRYHGNSENRKKKVSSAKKYYEKNKDSVNIKKAAYAKRNAEAVRERSRKYLMEWRRRPKSKAIAFMRNCLSRMLTYKKPRPTEECLGYTKENLVAHIEAQFQDGMTWSNHGEWHIDHIKPISVFLNEGVKDPSIINALSNLRPIWASENIKKGAKYNG